MSAMSTNQPRRPGRLVARTTMSPLTLRTTADVLPNVVTHSRDLDGSQPNNGSGKSLSANTDTFSFMPLAMSVAERKLFVRSPLANSTLRRRKCAASNADSCAARSLTTILLWPKVLAAQYCDLLACLPVCQERTLGRWLSYRVREQANNKVIKIALQVGESGSDRLVV